MVEPIAKSGIGRLDPSRTLPREKVGEADRKAPRDVDTMMPAARFARMGPPIDVTRVGEIRAAIAQGSYTVDADRLAAAMLALDLPVKSK